MNDSLEIRLKAEKEPTLWQRLIQWLHGGANRTGQSVQQVPKTGTNTEILLSSTQKIQLTEAVEAPGERTSDTSFIRRSESQDNQLII